MKELTVFNKTTEIVLSWKKLERQRQIRGVGSSGRKNCFSHAAFVDGGSQNYIMMMSSSHSPRELMRVEEGSPLLFSGWPRLML